MQHAAADSAVGSPGLRRLTASHPGTSASGPAWPLLPQELKVRTRRAQATRGGLWPYLPGLFFKNRNNYFKMNSFNEFHKGTCILLDLLFLKHTQKKEEKNGKKKDLVSIRLPFTTVLHLQADSLSPFYPSSEELTQLKSFPTG